jgi:hypothetical protein
MREELRATVSQAILNSREQGAASGMPVEDEPSRELKAPRRAVALLRAVALQVGLVLLTLAGLEVFLRVANFREVRLIPEQYRLPYEHDPELGWYPIANKVTQRGESINSIGLRDIELAPSAGPTMLFIGDSFVYGLGVKAEDRFTERLRQELPGTRIVNAGIAAYGTDQELLLLKRLWPRIEPSVVVLIVCVDNDHDDNSTNSRHGHTLKPYLTKVDGEWQFRGPPIPRGQQYYFYHNWLAQHSALVRYAIVGYMYTRYRAVTVPDPTAQLVGMMRDFVESHGAKFLVGLQHDDPDLEPYLAAQKIPYTRFDDAAVLPGDDHWSPQGHAIVAERLMTLLAAEHALGAVVEKQ